MRLDKLLIYSLIFSFCLGQFGRLSFFGGNVNIYIWDFLAVGLVGGWMVYKLGIEKKMKLPPLWLPIFVFSFIAFISLVNGFRWVDAREGIVAAGYWVRWVVYSGVYFVASDLFGKDSSIRYQVINTLIAAGVVLAMLGFVQLAIFPDLSQLDPELGWDPHKNRMVSTWLDPNFLGAYFVLCLCLLLSRLFFLFDHSPKEAPNNKFQISNVWNLVFGIWDFFTTSLAGLTVLSIILVIALLLTFSRSAWGMFAVVLGVFGILKSRKLLFLMVLMFFSAYFFIPRVQTRISGITDPADSAHFRLISWQRTFEIIRKYPVLGVGFNAFRYAQERAGYFRTERGVPVDSGHAGAGSDSSILLVWVTTGLLGLISYLWLYGSVAWQSLEEVTGSKRRNSYFSLSLLASLGGLFMESNFINSLFYSPVVICLWLSIAVALTD
ncbi:MAG: O-antigen ligase family protein [Patescibacteria group bacterium]|nr:O-antigen ligase family protein [Patescibacteria group bacterium]